MRTTSLTRTAKSAKGKLALTLFSALAVLGATSVLGAPKPVFKVSATPATQTVTAGEQTSYAITIDRKNKHTGSVALSVSGLPANATGTFIPNPVAGSGTSSSLGIKTNVNGTTPADTYTLTIRGTSGSTTSSTTVKLTVVEQSQANFSLTATPSQSVITADDSTSHDIDINRSGGFSSAVSLSVSGLPNGVSANYAPNPVSGTSAILVFTSNHNPKTGTYPVTVTGTGGGLTRAVSITLIVEEKRPFGIDGDAAQALAPGSPVPLDLALTNSQNFSLQVTELVVSVERGTSTPGCDGEENYSVDQMSAGSYPLALPANSTRTLSQLGVADADKPTVTMNDLATVNQDACKGATVFFDYSGAATK